MEERLDIYKRSHIYEQELKRFEKAKISPKNKELIMKFCHELFAMGCSDLRVAKLCSQLRVFGEYMDKDFEQVTRDDVLNALVKLQQSTIRIGQKTTRKRSLNTRKDYANIIKRFFKWLKGKNTPIVEDIRINSPESARGANFGDIISDEDINAVLKVCDSERDKALLALLHETGARAAELLNMKIKDISTTDSIKKVRLFGKTGERRAVIVTSVPYIVRYLETHPQKGNPNAYMWIGENPRYKNEPLHYIGLCRLIQRWFAKAGLSHKRANPHFFRHSRATINSKYLTDVQMCLFFGWKIGSGQVSTYVHASGRDVDDAILEMNGIKRKEERIIPNKPQQCPICKSENAATADYCSNCGSPLNVKVAMTTETKVKEETEKAFQLLIEISKNPELMREFNGFLQKRINKS